ncbi:MAG: hypothetical protein COB08_011780 [Rhodobacteraceae bacterium]|nr:hypothetical protein [Paracoccaceae bacterium]
MTEIVTKLIAKVNQAVGFKTLYRHDLDAIAMLTDAAKNELPSRFKKIVAEMDEHYNQYTRDDRFLFLRRLLEIYEVFRVLPSQSIDQLDSDGLAPVFTLDDKEKSKVLGLCNKMRKIVHSSVGFDEPHKIRLLNRIAAIEAEIHKEKGRFDVILAGVTDVGETLGKFGTSMKPLTDRMAEIANITRSKTKEYDQIPAPEEVKKIEDKSDDE